MYRCRPADAVKGPRHATHRPAARAGAVPAGADGPGGRCNIFTNIIEFIEKLLIV